LKDKSSSSSLISVDEVIEECFGNKDFLKTMDEICEMMETITSSDPQYSNYVKCVGVTLAILRRFCSSEKFRQQTTDRYLKYILKVPKVYSNVQESHSFLLKELAGLIGAISVDRKPLREIMKFN